jgi:hypothetical protein
MINFYFSSSSHFISWFNKDWHLEIRDSSWQVDLSDLTSTCPSSSHLVPRRQDSCLLFSNAWCIMVKFLLILLQLQKSLELVSPYHYCTRLSTSNQATLSSKDSISGLNSPSEAMGEWGGCRFRSVWISFMDLVSFILLRLSWCACTSAACWDLHIPNIKRNIFQSEEGDFSPYCPLLLAAIGGGKIGVPLLPFYHPLEPLNHSWF